MDNEINEASDSDSASTRENILHKETRSIESSDASSAGENSRDSDDEDGGSSSEESVSGTPLDVESLSDEETGEMDVSEHFNEDRHPGFTMCWDNVGKKVVTRNPSADHTNTYINMALGYIAINRVPTSSYDWSHLNELRKAIDIPVKEFLPSADDFCSLQDRMKILVGRILTRHLKWFEDNFQDCVENHIVHDFSLQSTQRSVLINLGTFNEDPCSTQGAIGIYERLQQYIPSVGNKPVCTIVYGNGLNCERGNDAQKARSNGLDAWERLEGLEPSAQEFHKEMLLLQDFYDEFFKGSSVRDRGSLAHIRNFLNYRQVKADVSDHFTHAWELMSVSTESLICLLAMEIYKMTDKDSVPENIPLDLTDFEERQGKFKEICSTIVNYLWRQPNINALQNDDGSGPPTFYCGEDLMDDTILCSARELCVNGEIFHKTCVSFDDNQVDGENWFCSENCRKNEDMYRYCHCTTNLGLDEPMIMCSAESKCKGMQWYHLKCVDIAVEDIPEGDWFCQPFCKFEMRGRRGVNLGDVVSKSCDHVNNYSRAMAWIGLNLLCRRDAVKEADGPAIISHWKIDLVQFFTRCHPKYTILAHRLIVSISGWLPPKLQQDLIHNRTVNYGGGMGRNLPLDFMNEILNRLFKDLLQSARGRYIDSTIHRCSQIVGPLGEALDAAFDTNIVENELFRHRRRYHNRDANVSTFIRFLKNDRLFSNIGGRAHTAFPEYNLNVDPKTAGKFPSKMMQLSKRFDRKRQIVLDAS